MSRRIAIIDLGTNTFHLLVAEIDGTKVNMLYREKQPVKIGLGGINAGLITGAAMERALNCLIHFRKLMDDWKVERSLAFGTSAMRSAANGKELVDKIRDTTGIEIALISGDEEAGYIYQGVRYALDLGLEKSLIVDIGGGSVEFIIGNRDAIFWKQSFDIGAQRMLEQYQKHDPIQSEEIELLEKHFEKVLAPLYQAYLQHKPTILVGSSGTFDTLSEIYCLRNHIHLSPDQSETPLTTEAFYTIHHEIISNDRASRMKIQGMIEMRVDMIVVASCLINFVLKIFPLSHIRVSAYSLKEGVLAQMASEH